MSQSDKAAEKTYAGVGSRDTPQPVRELMTGIAKGLAYLGWTLRSGAAEGADTAFEKGADDKEIFLPWSGYNDRYPKESGVYLGPGARQDPEARRIARQVHPAWEQMSQGAQKLHGRNAHQILGPDLDAPVERVLCWTPDGAETASECSRETGGTATAIRLASEHGVDVHNLKNPRREDAYREWLATG